MKPRALALIALAVALGGCVENISSIQAMGFCAPPEDAATCGLPDCQTLIGQAYALWADPAATTASAATPLEGYMEWQNNLADNAQHTNDFYIQGYDWQAESPQAKHSFRSRFTVQGLVKANGTLIDSLDVLPPDVTLALQTDYALWTAAGNSGDMPVMVYLKAFGTLGGTYFETGPAQAAVYFSTSATPMTFACPAGKTLSAVCPPTGRQAPVTLACQ